MSESPPPRRLEKRWIAVLVILLGLAATCSVVVFLPAKGNAWSSIPFQLHSVLSADYRAWPIARLPALEMDVIEDILLDRGITAVAEEVARIEDSLDTPVPYFQPGVTPTPLMSHIPQPSSTPAPRPTTSDPAPSLIPSQIPTLPETATPQDTPAPTATAGLPTVTPSPTLPLGVAPTSTRVASPTPTSTLRPPTPTAPILPTATALPPTATQLPPTRTLPPPTSTLPLSTATPLPPTATQAPPTPTPPPTATPQPTATRLPTRTPEPYPQPTSNPYP